MKTDPPETIGTKLQPPPVWLRPIIGLLVIPLFVLSLPLLIPLAIGKAAWDKLHRQG